MSFYFDKFNFHKKDLTPFVNENHIADYIGKVKYSTKEKTYSMTEAAKALDVSRLKLQELMKEGKLEYTMNALGTIYRIKLSEIESFKQRLNKESRKDNNVTDTEYNLK